MSGSHLKNKKKTSPAFFCFQVTGTDGSFFLSWCNFSPVFSASGYKWSCGGTRFETAYQGAEPRVSLWERRTNPSVTSKKVQVPKLYDLSIHPFLSIYISSSQAIDLSSKLSC